MEKDLETLLEEIDAAAWNQGYSEARGEPEHAEECRKAVEEAKQEIRDFMSKDD